MSVADIFDETMKLLRSSSAFVVVFILILAGGGVAIDMEWLGPYGDIGYNVLYFAMGLALHIVLFRSAGIGVNATGLLVLSYFGLSIVYTLGVLLGLVFLILPGIFFAVRWTPAYAYLLAEEETITESLSRAWDATEGNFWPIFIASLLPMVMTFGIAGIYFASTFLSGQSIFDEPIDAETVSLSASVASNAVAVAGQALAIAIGLAVYLLLEGNRSSLEEVFE